MRRSTAEKDGSDYTTYKLRLDLGKAAQACAEIPEDKKPKVTTHVLRHTAASLMVAAGVPIFDVAKILGHSTVTVTMRYAHFAPEAGRAAVKALDGLLDLHSDSD
ncbi:MAG: tyrosine-type recombinase/integrase [Planctomycetota bacterium]|nr:tyrosine-type recombinase/integrase [Planctomycetota bacterium]